MWVAFKASPLARPVHFFYLASVLFHCVGRLVVFRARSWGCGALGELWKPVLVSLDDVFAEAAERAAAMPIYNRSMRGVAANEVGATGEIVAMRYLRACGFEVVDSGTYEKDLLVDGLRVEVKTKERSVAPRMNYDCSAPAYNRDKQIPDWWLFVSLTNGGRGRGVERFRDAWVCGAILDADLRAKGRLLGVDDVDKSNGWKPTIPVWNVHISDLDDPTEVCSPAHP